MKSNIDARTQLAGNNRLELLLFKLKDNQIYGINVFKVREILKKPKLNSLPHSKECIAGVAQIRGETVSVIDIDKAMRSHKNSDEVDNQFVLVTEYNRKVQGFLVQSVDKIINIAWEDVQAPPKSMGSNHYLTAITNYENKLIQVLDVEKILDEVCAVKHELVHKPVEISVEMRNTNADCFVCVVDDSLVARKQVERCLEQLALPYKSFKNGEEAYNALSLLNTEGKAKSVMMVVSDVEMPQMDGYTLTSKLKESLYFKDTCIILHTSLSGAFNEAMVKKVGANYFIPKFEPNELMETIVQGLEDYLEKK